MTAARAVGVWGLKVEIDVLSGPGEAAHRPVLSVLPWWGRYVLGILSRDPQCAPCGYGPTLLATPGSPPGLRRWVLCQGMAGAVGCALVCPTFQGREGCDLTAKGMVCLAL